MLLNEVALREVSMLEVAMMMVISSQLTIAPGMTKHTFRLRYLGGARYSSIPVHIPGYICTLHRSHRVLKYSSGTQHFYKAVQ